MNQNNILFNSLTRTIQGESRTINAENKHGCISGGGKSSSELGIGRKGSPCILDIHPRETVSLADFNGTGIIQHMWFTLLDCPHPEARLLETTFLLIYWNNSSVPSVEVPLGNFFCCGFNKSCQIFSQPIAVNPYRSMNCYFPMPFHTNFRIVLENRSDYTIPRLFYQIDFQLVPSLPEDTVFFHATWNQRTHAPLGEDYTILNAEGSGHYVGTYLALTTKDPGCWCEGEMKFFLDDDLDFPTICGTGTEDYFGGAWAFGVPHNENAVETTFSSLYSGFPYCARPNVNQTICHRSLYRFHIPDPIIFHKKIRVTLQQMGKANDHLYERQDPISSVAYWYRK